MLRLLGVDRGVVAVTKADTVDEETLELALDEARELVPGAEVVAVSAKTGAGLDELRAALARVPVETRDAGAATRLYVDRVFTLQGAGTIATGTLWSGSISAGDALRVEPRGSTVRVRSVQVHDTAVERAEAGQRVAVNLPTVERRDLARGDVLVEPGHYPVSYRLDVRLEPLQEIPAAVTVHVGTKAVPARVVRDGDYAQLRLQERVVTARGDRVVLRTDTTVGGGTVLDPSPTRRLERSRLEALDQGTPEEIVTTLVHAPVTATDLQARGLLSPAELAQGLSSVRSSGDYFFSDAWLADTGARCPRTSCGACGVEPARSRGTARRAPAERAVGAVDHRPARRRAPRREGISTRGDGRARGARRRGRGTRVAARA